MYRTLSWLLVSFSFLFLACQDTEAGFNTVEDETGDAQGDDDPEVISDDDDATEATTWDPSPPDVEPGTVLFFEADCDLAVQPGQYCWEFDGTAWQRYDDCLLLQISPGAIESCFELVGEEDETLRWTAEGELRFYSGTWVHDLLPTAVEGAWAGQVFLEGNDPSEDCLDWLAENSLPYPFTIRLRRQP